MGPYHFGVDLAKVGDATVVMTVQRHSGGIIIVDDPFAPPRHNYRTILETTMFFYRWFHKPFGSERYQYELDRQMEEWIDLGGEG